MLNMSDADELSSGRSTPGSPRESVHSVLEPVAQPVARAISGEGKQEVPESPKRSGSTSGQSGQMWCDNFDRTPGGEEKSEENDERPAVPTNSPVPSKADMSVDSDDGHEQYRETMSRLERENAELIAESSKWLEKLRADSKNYAERLTSDFNKRKALESPPAIGFDRPAATRPRLSPPPKLELPVLPNIRVNTSVERMDSPASPVTKPEPTESGRRTVVFDDSSKPPSVLLIQKVPLIQVPANNEPLRRPHVNPAMTGPGAIPKQVGEPKRKTRSPIRAPTPGPDPG